MSDDENDDRYARTGGTKSPAELLGNVDLDPLLGKTAEWWEQRDREVAALRQQDAEMTEQARMTARAGELSDNGFPEMFITSALGELGQTEPMRFARLFVRLPQRLLVLAGGVGAGKTTAATWVALKGQDPRPAFMRISELERRGRYDKKLNVWLKDMTSLVIDDVGAEFLDGKGAFRALMDEVVDVFYSGRRTLVLTTNLRPSRASPDEQEQFIERYGQRVWSRLTEAGVWGDCGVRDLRKEQP